MTAHKTGGAVRGGADIDGPVGTSSAGRSRPGRSRRWLATSVILQVVAMIAIGLLVYPDAADWFASLRHNSEISGYIERVNQTPTEEQQRILAAAYAYNEQLVPGPLTDPYVSLSEDEVRRSPVYLAYEQLLRLTGTEAIGTLSYPRLSIALPIYHGTSNQTISRGIGHMYGTSLPVGGPSTQAVLTSHSGLPSAKLFTNLLRAQVGDQFWISVLGEEHYYQVRSVETVIPGDTKSLQIIKGEDWVTLFTCTPVGINSHRFMVHAQRIPNPPADNGSTAIAGDGVRVGFPWWAVWFFGGSAVIGWVLFAPPRRRRRRPADASL